MTMDLLHSDGQLMTEMVGDTEKGFQKPAVQQKTNDDDDDGGTDAPKHNLLLLFTSVYVYITSMTSLKQSKAKAKLEIGVGRRFDARLATKIVQGLYWLVWLCCFSSFLSHVLLLRCVNLIFGRIYDMIWMDMIPVTKNCLLKRPYIKLVLNQHESTVDEFTGLYMNLYSSKADRQKQSWK